MPNDHVMAETPMDRTVGVRLVVHCVDPVTGAARIDGQAEETPFCGWIALMAIINEACRELGASPPAPAGT
jgi:hypothetical protein